MLKSTLFLIVLIFFIYYQRANAQNYGYSDYYNPYPVYYQGGALSSGYTESGSGNSLANLYLTCDHCTRG